MDDLIKANIDYYKNQAGTGLSSFQGYKFQRGNGFFGDLFSNVLKPLGKYFTKQALTTGVNIGSDLLSGESINNSFKKRSNEVGKRILGDAIGRAQKFAQTGKGSKRKKRRSGRKSVKTKINIKRKKRQTKRKVCKKRKTKKSVKRVSSKNKHLLKLFK